MKYIFIWKSTVLSILFAFDFWRPVFNIRSPITIWHRHFCGLQAFLPSSPSFPSLPSPPSFPSNNPHTLLKYLPSFLLFQENPIALTTPGVALVHLRLTPTLEQVLGAGDNMWPSWCEEGFSRAPEKDLSSQRFSALLVTICSYVITILSQLIL